MLHVPLETTLVYIFILVDDLTLTTSESIFPFTFIFRFISVGHIAFTIIEIVVPLTIIDSPSFLFFPGVLTFLYSLVLRIHEPIVFISVFVKDKLLKRVFGFGLSV